MDSAGFIVFGDEAKASVCYDDCALTFEQIREIGAADGRARGCLFCCKAVPSRPFLTRSGSLARVALPAGWSHTCPSQVSVSADAGILSAALPYRPSDMFAAPGIRLGASSSYRLRFSPPRRRLSSCARRHALFFSARQRLSAIRTLLIGFEKARPRHRARDCTFAETVVSA